MEKKNISITNLSEIYFNKIFNENKSIGIKMHKNFQNYLLRKKINLNNFNNNELKIFNYFKDFLFFYKNFKCIEIEKKISYEYNNVIINGRLDAIFIKYDKILNENIYYFIDWKICYNLSVKKINELQLIMNIYSKIFFINEINKKTFNFKLLLIILHHKHKSFIIKELDKIDLDLNKLIKFVN